MDKKFQLEVCVDSVESAIEGEKGGADRFELCGHLLTGGVTPSISLFQGIKQACKVPIHVLIRPRFGDFLYTDYEFAMMVNDIKIFRDLGADGVVIGMLKPDGSLDCERMKELIHHAGTMNIVLHRAFDVCCDPKAAMEEAIDMGISLILTSGQKQTCLEGCELLKELNHQSSGRIGLMAGAGINKDVIAKICKKTGILSYHMSGKEIIKSEMVYRNEDVNMGLKGISEYEIMRTSSMEIQKAKQVFRELT